MTPELVLPLVGLALIDSTSFGTLLIPVWLLLAPGRVRVGRLAVYLATVAAFYLVVGLALAAGAGTLLAWLGTLAEGIPAETLRGTQLALGVGLFGLSYLLEARANRAGPGTGRLRRWRARATADSGSRSGLVGLALLAGTLEVATMLPYLAAIGLLTSAEPGWRTTTLALVGYCLLMVAPAFALTGLRVVASRRVGPLQERLDGWLSRNSGKVIGWTVGAIGVWLALNALANLPLSQLPIG